MKLAVVGSRSITGPIGRYLDPYRARGISLLVSGGARGVDTSAARYAQIHRIEQLILLPDYNRYGRGAPIVRNREIVRAADCVLALWDGVSPGTKFTIACAEQSGKPVRVILVK